MTDTKPTIDQQIKHQQNTVKIIEDFDDQESLPKEQAILASLEDYKRIHEAEMPEPVAWCVAYNGPPTEGTILSNPTMYKPEADEIVRHGSLGLSVASLYGHEFLTYAQQVKHNSSVTMDELGEMRDRAENAERERDALIAENEVLRKLLVEAAEDIEGWGAYAGEYFQKKHDLAGNVKQYRDAAIDNALRRIGAITVTKCTFTESAK